MSGRLGRGLYERIGGGENKKVPAE